MADLGELICNSKFIKSISLEANLINDLGVEILTEKVEANISLRSLNLSRNKNITDYSIPNLYKLIRRTRIERLPLDGTLIGLGHYLYVYLVINEIRNGNENLDMRKW